jgi:hypothetical protein
VDSVTAVGFVACMSSTKQIQINDLTFILKRILTCISMMTSYHWIIFEQIIRSILLISRNLTKSIGPLPHRNSSPKTGPIISDICTRCSLLITILEVEGSSRNLKRGLLYLSEIEPFSLLTDYSFIAPT